MNARRTLAVVIGAALAAGTGGYVTARQMHAPGDELARARPPDPGPVTAEVERRTLERRVVVRGDAVFAGAVDVTVDTSALTTAAVVTGVPVDVGDEVAEGSVLAVIAERPVIVLGGEIPAYRALTPGMTGDDVRQLEAALDRLGHDPGPVDGRYDSATAAAVERLYAQLGFPAPRPSDAATARHEAAEQNLAAADARLRHAATALAAAAGPPARSAVLAAEAAVAAARHQVDAAVAAGDEGARVAADAQRRVAEAQLEELRAGRDTAVERAEADAAAAERDAAAAELMAAAAAAATPFPAAELVFVADLPRRVDALSGSRGATLDGPLARLSGTELVVRAELGSADRQLVSLGDRVVVDGAGVTVHGAISQLADDAATGSSVATVMLEEAHADVVSALAGLNVRVVVPLDATEGDVLAVPLAALTTGGDGSSRVEVLQRDGTTRPVTVAVGLVADGFAEVRPRDPAALPVGADVVVGR